MQATRRPGVYALSPVIGLLIVVADGLPDGEATLWLRLLGRGAVQRRAIGQLLAMRADKEHRAATLQLMAAWRQKLSSRHELSTEERADVSNWRCV